MAGRKSRPPGRGKPVPARIKAGERQAAPTATTKPNGNRNGPAAGKSRPAGSAPANARSASAARAIRPDGGARAVSPGAPGPVGRSCAVRTVGFVPLATFLLSLYALAASMYLTIAHFDTNVTLVCSDKGVVNCAEVTTSPQSMVFGIFPVAVLGLASTSL